MSLVGRRIDVNVREYMVHRHANPDAGNLGSPEEVPVLIDLEVFIPANRLQDVAMHDVLRSNCKRMRTRQCHRASIFAPRNMKNTT